jgi:thiamine-phosphate pyrophosphorylase
VEVAASGAQADHDRSARLVTTSARSRAARLASARLYFITPDVAPDDVLALVRAVVAGGADVVQLRHKTLPRGELLALARRAREIVDETRLFVVNDHVDIALLSDADGVHLGPDDLSIASARKVAGGRPLLIGASASTPDAAIVAADSGADYLGTGPAFATPIKTEKKVIGPGGVAAVAKAVGTRIPVFAIGGIDATTINQLIEVGIRRVCVIRGIADADDPEAAARALRAMLDV